jgi:hypothetical protein
LDPGVDEEAVNIRVLGRYTANKQASNEMYKSLQPAHNSHLDEFSHICPISDVKSDSCGSVNSMKASKLIEFVFRLPTAMTLEPSATNLSARAAPMLEVAPTRRTVLY